MQCRIPMPAAFLLVLASCAAARQAIDLPHPASAIGFEVGADSRLADWEDIADYFKALDQASDRVAVEGIGRSTEGREMLLAVISSEANLAARARIQGSLRRLADPRGLSEEERERLIAETPAAVLVGCAQHATEIGSTQMSMELAWRLAGGEEPELQRIREEVVLLLVPSLNPDGHQMVCDWYREHLGTPFEGGRMPWLYQKYVGHDINRDWAMMTQAECRNVSRVLYEEWVPQIVIDVHQMGRRGARMFLPPYHDPINPNIDPILDHELGLVSAQMRLDLSIAGLTGVISNAMFDEWLMGYLTSVPGRHNMVALLIEMASANVASPVFQRRSELSGSGGADYGRRTNFPEPWPGGWWRLRDIVEYEQTAILSALGLASRSREMFLTNFCRMAAAQVEAGREEPPFAFLVPPGQRDPFTAAEMLSVLQRGGVEVHEALAPFEADGVEYPDGTRVVLMAQPFRAHAKDLLERQTYPDLRSSPDDPPQRPYDVTGWTLPLLMGVQAAEIVAPFEAELRLLDRSESPFPGGGASPTGRWTLIGREQNGAYVLVNRLLKRGREVRSLVRGAEVEGRPFSAGTFVVERSDLPAIDDLGLEVQACSELPEESMLTVGPVRLGLYQPWTTSMDEGWTRWVLERHEFDYRSLHDSEIRAGGLRSRYDAIVLPDLRPRSIVEGVSEGSLPKQYCGGIGEEGVFALRDFAREGGTLVALDSSCDLLIDALELPVQRVSEGEDGERLYCPGSILRIDVDVEHPLAFGLAPATAVMFSSSPVLESKPDDEKQGKEEGDSGWAAVGTYPRMNPLLSGWIENDEILHGKAALGYADCGEGSAILIGFRCQYRAQTHATFKVLFNAILSAGQEPIEGERR